MRQTSVVLLKQESDLCVFLETIQCSEVAITARKTVFPRLWNIMESSKRPTKYYLYINFLAKKKDRISDHQKAQHKNFSEAQNMSFSVISKYDLSINFLSHKRPHFPSRKSSKQELLGNW